MSTEAYKNSHPPRPMMENEKNKPHQGIYVPKHPEKVVGGQVITRSSWESSFARWCDDSPSVIEWGCEVITIQYRNPAGVNLDACKQYNLSPGDPANWPVHNYYPDFYVCLRDESDTDGTKVKKLLIEIKPFYQTEKPSPTNFGDRLKDQKKFVEAAKTYLQNVKKWEAAMVWANEHGYEFKVFTEHTLEKMGII